MLFKASAALVLTLFSIATSASPKTARALKPRGTQPTGSQPPPGLPGPTGITISPVDHENVTAGYAFNMLYQGFKRVTLQTATIEVHLNTQNGLNQMVFATDLAAKDDTALFDADFLLPRTFHALEEEKGKPLVANLVIYERDEQFYENGTFNKYQMRFKAQAPFVVVRNVVDITNGMTSA